MQCTKYTVWEVLLRGFASVFKPEDINDSVYFVSFVENPIDCKNNIRPIFLFQI